MATTVEANPVGLVSGAPSSRRRDERLDMFRGLALLLIAVTHMGGNWLVEILPSHFGFSSGTEMFVFCSGIASGLAFGGLYVKRGFWLGTVRVSHRVWQIYWAHIASFVGVLALTVFLAGWLGKPDYFASLQQDVFLTHPRQALVGLVTLGYLPPLFDILPIYIVMLAMVPLVMAARLVSPSTPFLVVGILYLLVWTVGIHLPANPTQVRQDWLFNPFAWQLLFFTGFFIAMGWIKIPAPGTPWATAAALAVVLVSVPLCWSVLYENFGILSYIRDLVLPGSERTNFHLLRFIHFLAAAYLAVTVLAALPALSRSQPARILAMTGRETLAAFLASVPIAILGGTALDIYGTSPRMVVLATILSWAGIIGTAHVASYVKSRPWSRPAVAQAETKAAPAKADGLVLASPMRPSGAATA